jgi:hypothetical protein
MASPYRVPSNFDEGFSEETQSQPGSDDIDMGMGGDMKDTPDPVGELMGLLVSLPQDERVNVMRQAALTLSTDDQLGM